jgi:hypothetical protein
MVNTHLHREEKMKDKCVVYDFETLGTDTFTSPVISLAVLKYDEARFQFAPYQFEELVEASTYIKFDVEEQVRKYGRKIQQDTLDWWARQNAEARAMIKPSDMDVSIDKLYDILYNDLKIQECKYQYARGNTFDAGFLKSILRACGKDCPLNLKNSRDTRSLIAGMSWGVDIKNHFTPEGLDRVNFVAHDPRCDVAMDVMRIQYLARIPYEMEDDVPF